MKRYRWVLPCILVMGIGSVPSDIPTSEWTPDCKSLAQSSLEDCHAQRTLPNVSKKASKTNMKFCLAIAYSTYTMCVEMTRPEQEGAP